MTASKVQKATETKAKTRKLPPNAGKGRKKGVPNKATKEFRETISQLLSENSKNVGLWLEEVATGKTVTVVSKEGKETEQYIVTPDPGKALDLLAKLAEYAAPKLSRAEHVGDGGGDLTVVIKRYSDD